MINLEGPEIWHTRTYFAPCCPAKFMNRPQGIWSLDQFTFRNQIGAGHASIVYLVRDTVADTNLALKCYPGAAAKPDVRTQVAHEIGIHAQLQHPNILPLYGAFVENDDILLITPYAAQGSVYHLLRGTQRPVAEEFSVSGIIKPFLSGIAYLHRMGIMHRDIKTENVVVDERSQVMIADFGLAINTNTTSANLRVGTPLYMAPEVFSVQSNTTSASWVRMSGPVPRWRHESGGHRASAPAEVSIHSRRHTKEERCRGYNDKADCWSAAVFIYEVLTGSTPFAHIHHRQALQRAVLFSPISPPQHLSSPAQAFLTWALNRTPQVRPSIVQMLQHPWLSNGPPAPTPAPRPSDERASAPPCNLRPSSAPLAMARAMACATDAAASPSVCDTEADSADPLVGPQPCPSRLIIGFAPATAPSPPSTASSSLQTTGEVHGGEAARLGDMHRAVLEALRLRPMSPSLTARSHSSSQRLQKSESLHSCPCKSSTAALCTCSGSGALTPRTQSAMLPCSAPWTRPPTRMSSLTQALMLQRDASCSDLQSPLQGSPLRQAPTLPPASPSPCGRSGLAPGPEEMSPAAGALPRQPSGLPCANVTVIYACDLQVSPPMEESVLPEIQEGTREGAASEQTASSEATSAHAACHASLARPSPHDSASQAGPDRVMQEVAASVFTDCMRAAPGTSRSADAVSARGHGPAAAELPCPHREAVGGRCGNCQAAADLASIWQRAAEPSPIQRQMNPHTLLPHREPCVLGAYSLDGATVAATAGCAPDCTVSAPVNQVSADSVTGVPPRGDAIRLLLGIAAIGDPSSAGADEERCYEVRGSWGGSIDSTAGATFARLSKRLDVAVSPESLPVGSVQGRVASWVANAAAALWDPVAEASTDSNECFSSAMLGVSASADDPHLSRSSAAGSCAPPVPAYACGRGGDAVASLFAGGFQSNALKMWETGTADRSRELDAPHSLTTIAAARQRSAGQGTTAAGLSCGEDSDTQTADSAAPVGGSIGCPGGGARPWLQSYGIDSSTVSLHALAAALTPSMNDPSLLRSSLVFPESHDE